jgi:uncharacterized SAM-binding protein YcdF (DUF218 family)
MKRLLLGVAFLPLLWAGYRFMSGSFKHPQAILVLGGDTRREDFAAHFAHQHPELPVWVSGGSNPEYTEGVFGDAGIAPDKLHLDRAAVDTVTNFTTLADQLKHRGIDSVYLITSDYHMGRAQIIGEIVFGSRGIDIKPVVVPSQQQPEPFIKSLRDGARAILWVTTGYSGSAWNSRDLNNR